MWCRSRTLETFWCGPHSILRIVGLRVAVSPQRVLLEHRIKHFRVAGPVRSG